MPNCPQTGCGQGDLHQSKAQAEANVILVTGGQIIVRGNLLTAVLELNKADC